MEKLNVLIGTAFASHSRIKFMFPFTRPTLVNVADLISSYVKFRHDKKIHILFATMYEQEKKLRNGTVCV